jgi:nucleotide-binding universal stress UspA family protein
MFQRILVPTDLTETTHGALALAVDLARRRFGSEITVLHVIARVPNLPDRELRDFYERLEHVACGRITSLLTDIAGTDDVRITHRVMMGKPADEIVQFAEQNKTDLIVLQHSEDESRLGSVSYKVSVTAPCSVLLLKGKH